MFKLVVLFALIAAAVCEPKPGAAILSGAYLNGAATYAYASPYVAPAAAATYYNAQPYIYSSPYAYSTPAHFIKKRSAAFAYAPTYYPSTYLASAPLATSYSYGSSASLLHSAPVLPATSLTYAAPAHFIKKRSAPLAISSTYIAPTSYAYAPTSPLLTTSYSYGAAAPYYASPYYASGPFAYSTFIKK